MRYDVVVVGAGPAGSMLARMLAKEGYRIAVLEEHREAGKPVSCAGLVTDRVIDLAGVDDTVVMNTIKGAYAYSPGGREVKIGGDKKHAVVIDRERFDKEMADMAIAEGAEYKFGWRFSGAHEKEGFISVTGKEEMECRYLVGADGAMSTVASQFGFPEPKEYIRAMQTTIPYDTDREYVKVFLGNDVAPGFFAWVIPEGEEKKARIGLGVSGGHGLGDHFTKFMKFLNEKGAKGSINAGVIPIGMRSPLSTGNGRVSLIGDAAAQVKATSGGGLYPGILAANVLALSLRKILDGRSDSMSYERDYNKGFGKELKRSMMMRKFFLKMDDKKMDAIFDSLDNGVIKTINEYGDIDYPSVAAKKVIKKYPGMLKFLFLPF